MTRKKINNKKSLAERQFGVILEDIDSKFDRVLEGHGGLSKEIKDFRGEFNTFKDETGFNFKVLTGEVSELRGEFNGFRKETALSFKAVREYLSRIDEEIQDLKKVLDKKADLERLQRLELKVAEIELAVKKYYGKNSN